MSLDVMKITELWIRASHLAREGALLWEAEPDEFKAIVAGLDDYFERHPERERLCIRPELVDNRMHVLFGGMVVVTQ